MNQRYLLDRHVFADRDGPWYEQAFTEPAIRQRSAAKGITLPDLIVIKTTRTEKGWLVTVYEIAESDG